VVRKLISILLICTLLVLSSCVKQATYQPYPIITLQGVSQTAVNLYPSQGGPSTDSISITIGFTDGEGGIGPVSGTQDTSTQIVPCTDHAYDASVINNPAYNVFWYEYHASHISTDSCIDRIYTAYVPDNPKNLSISGTIQIFPDVECPPTGNVDTISYSIFINDRAGKVSNRVRTPPIVITCN